MEKIALSHGVEWVAVATFGVSSFHGIVDSSLRWSQVGPTQDGHRDKRLDIGIRELMGYGLMRNAVALPGGVIGNTWAFGAHVPGSSPGRVGLNREAFLVKRQTSYT